VAHRLLQDGSLALRIEYLLRGVLLARANLLGELGAAIDRSDDFAVDGVQLATQFGKRPFRRSLIHGGSRRRWFFALRHRVGFRVRLG
jgi:hypothetical protein